jgi:predicted RNA binding protein YcfA (HicA-like mRNA interferase family)
LKQVSRKEFARFIQKHGWLLKRINGSHRILTKEGQRESLVIPVTGGGAAIGYGEVKLQIPKLYHKCLCRINLSPLHESLTRALPGCHRTSADSAPGVRARCEVEEALHSPR